MPHDHSHHHHADLDSGDKRVVWAVVVNILLTVAQIVAGVVSGSLALIADAIHNLSDALSLVIAFAARRIGKRPADARMTFGCGRAEVVAALVNYTTLIVVAIYLAAEGIERLFNPQQVEGYILWHSWLGGLPVIRVLMLGAPEGTDLNAVLSALRSVPGVADIHHVHLWHMQEHETALEAHVVLDGSVSAEPVKRAVKDLLRRQFDVSHSVLELEAPGSECADAQVVGH